MRRYGRDNIMEDKNDCIVSNQGEFGCSYQCQRKRKCGPNGGYCKQHAKMLAEGKFIYVPKNKKESCQFCKKEL